MPHNDQFDARHVVQELVSKGYIDNQSDPDLFEFASQGEVQLQVDQALAHFCMYRRHSQTHGIIVARNRSQRELSHEAEETGLKQLKPIFPTRSLNYHKSVVMVTLRARYDEEVMNVKPEYAGLTSEAVLIDMMTVCYDEGTTGDEAKFTSQVRQWVKSLVNQGFVEKKSKDGTEMYRISRLALSIFDHDTCARFRQKCQGILAEEASEELEELH